MSHLSKLCINVTPHTEVFVSLRMVTSDSMAPISIFDGGPCTHSPRQSSLLAQPDPGRGCPTKEWPDPDGHFPPLQLKPPRDLFRDCW